MSMRAATELPAIGQGSKTIVGGCVVVAARLTGYKTTQSGQAAHRFDGDHGRRHPIHRGLKRLLLEQLDIIGAESQARQKNGHDQDEMMSSEQSMVSSFS